MMVDGAGEDSKRWLEVEEALENSRAACAVVLPPGFCEFHPVFSLILYVEIMAVSPWPCTGAVSLHAAGWRGRNVP